MSQSNPLWGAPRIHGGLLKLGIDVSQATVSKYMVKPEHRPSQSWQTFLTNHARDIVSIDFFTVPTATFRVLYVFLVLDNARRKILHFNVTQSPTAAWTGQQIVEAFPWDTTPRFLIEIEMASTAMSSTEGRSPWHRTGPYLTPFPLAESICRACDRVDP